MALIRVLEIPRGDGNFRFSGGSPQTFMEVDWFRDDEPHFPQMKNPEDRQAFIDHVTSKKYYDPAKAYLVMHQDASFTINYSAP